MSYPNNLGARINHITNYSTNSVKLNPDNSQTELVDITSGARIQFTLPPNSLVDLSSFSVYADFETAVAASNTAYTGVLADIYVRPHYLTRNANSLIRRLIVEVGGQTVSDIEDYNRIQQIFSDYQFGIEGSSKKLLSNIDPLDKRGTSLLQISASRVLPNTGTNVDVKFDKRPICLTQFLGWLGGGAGVKYIDTQLTGNVKITFELAPANNVLFRSTLCQTDGTAIVAGTYIGLEDVNCAPQAKYSLKKVFATIKKASIDDGVYFNSITAALSSGIPFEYKYNHFYQTKSNTTNGDLQMRYELMSNSVDMCFLSFYENTYNTAVANLPDVDKLNDVAVGGLEIAITPINNAKDLSILGATNCFCSGYFKRNGSFIKNAKFYINGERLPQYDMEPPQIYNQSLIDFGIHDDTANGIYYGINSFESWKRNYWVATARLSHVCNDDTYISGFNANGVPLTIGVETVSDGVATAVYTAQLHIMTTQVMSVYAGRQINIQR
jgi:hypothetical protein